MNEFVPEDDPEPLSWDIQKYIDTSVIAASHYVDDGLASLLRSEDAQPDYEIDVALKREQQEIRAIELLSRRADTLFEIYATDLYDDDTTIKYGDDVTLRRKLISRQVGETGRKIPDKIYFFNDHRGNRPYCRIWAQSSHQVNWCNEQGLHEPAQDVLTHLNEAFTIPQPHVAETLLRRIAAPVLKHLLRQKV